MSQFHKSLQRQLAVYVVIILIAIVAVVHVTIHFVSKRYLENETTTIAQRIAVGVSELITRDIDAYKTFVDLVDQYKRSQGYDISGVTANSMPDDLYANEEYYQHMQQVFSRIQLATPAHYIYTIRQLDDEFLEFILDGEPVENITHSPPCSHILNTLSFQSAFETGEPSRFGLTLFGHWGHVLGANAPLYDADKEIIGIVGVIIPGVYYSGPLIRLQFVMLAVYAVVVLAALLTLSSFSTKILEPLLKDKLTGAYSKRYADNLINDEINTAIKWHQDLTLMLLDLDHFKMINDTYGHNFGDLVLASASKTVQNVLRHKDYFIRYGGEEFIAVFPGIDEKGAATIAERIRASVENMEIINQEQNISVKITISIGIAILQHTGLNAQEFIELADKALYTAKENRNCVSVYPKS